MNGGYYRKKPVMIRAIQWHEKRMLMHDVLKFFGGLEKMNGRSILRRGGVLYVHTLEGEMRVDDGDWIIQGVKGEIYPCKPDIFAETYDKV